MLLGGSDGGTTTVKTWKMAQEPPPLSTRFFGCMFIHSVTNQIGYKNKKYHESGVIKFDTSVA